MGKKKKATEEANEQVDLFNDYLDEANAEARNIELGTYQSAVGTAYKAILKEDDWTKDSELPPFRIFIPYPGDCYIVYSRKNGKPMLSVQILKDENEQQYYLCFSAKQYFEIQNGQITKTGINGFGGIPVVEYPNNHDRLSDIEIAITMFDTMNNMQSNRMDGVEQFVQALMKFKNCEIDESEFLKMIKLGAISVKDTGNGCQSDVDLMTAELKQKVKSQKTISTATCLLLRECRTDSNNRLEIPVKLYISETDGTLQSAEQNWMNHLSGRRRKQLPESF